MCVSNACVYQTHVVYMVSTWLKYYVNGYVQLKKRRSIQRTSSATLKLLRVFCTAVTMRPRSYELNFLLGLLMWPHE